MQVTKLGNARFERVKKRVDNMKNLGDIRHRFKHSLFIVPAMVVTGITIGNFVRTSFAVYLKHQALVDSYYQH